MYDAAARLAVENGCSVIGIQYQHGLQGLCVASDLAEGLLNNPERPPVRDAQGKVLREGQPIVHFNEVDEGAGLDALIITGANVANPRLEEEAFWEPLIEVVEWAWDNVTSTLCSMILSKRR